MTINTKIIEIGAKFFFTFCSFIILQSRENGSKWSLVVATYDEDEEQTERKFPDMKKAPYADLSYYPSSDEEEVEELNNNEKGAGELNNVEVSVMEQRDHYIQLYAPPEVGKTVRLPIDPVDHLKIGHPKLLGVVMEVDNGFYKICTKNGVLSQRFTRNQLESSDNDLEMKFA